ncbi:MAG: hypothetical protein Q8R92_08920 [Deltaproteobacteria bacterium]|nr:hypothetical protein [Deltaproteobacteria bacterium]
MQNEKLKRVVFEMENVMESVKARSMLADDAHAIVRAGAVIVKAHEVDAMLQRRGDGRYLPPPAIEGDDESPQPLRTQ